MGLFISRYGFLITSFIFFALSFSLCCSSLACENTLNKNENEINSCKDQNLCSRIFLIMGFILFFIFLILFIYFEWFYKKICPSNSTFPSHIHALNDALHSNNQIIPASGVQANVPGTQIQGNQFGFNKRR